MSMSLESCHCIIQDDASLHDKMYAIKPIPIHARQLARPDTASVLSKVHEYDLVRLTRAIAIHAR